MKPFNRLAGIAAPLPLANIDTDMILSARFLKTISRDGLGGGLLHALRYDADERERPEFILNRAPWRAARILVTLDNFGCGSSREHAPWALLDFGISCVIAPSFADIFYGNCFKNGILPIVLPRDAIDTLLVTTSQAETADLAVDLEQQSIAHAGGKIAFAIDKAKRARLLGGRDDIAIALERLEDIDRHEQTVRETVPWLSDPRLANAL